MLSLKPFFNLIKSGEPTLRCFVVKMPSRKRMYFLNPFDKVVSYSIDIVKSYLEETFSCTISLNKRNLDVMHI